MATQNLRTYICKFCKGTGMIKCPICKGTGTKPRTDGMFHSCKGCNGIGKIKCEKCNRGKTYIKSDMVE